MKGKMREEEEERNQEDEEEEHEFSPLISDPKRERKTRVERTDWCDCKKCPQMPTEEECVCCHEDEAAWVTALEGGLEGERQPINCLTEHPFFKAVCLNPYAVRSLYSRDMRLFEEDEEENTTDEHQKYRLTSCRAFVEFFHNILQEELEVPLPACVATHIRTHFTQRTSLPPLPYL